MKRKKGRGSVCYLLLWMCVRRTQIVHCFLQTVRHIMLSSVAVYQVEHPVLQNPPKQKQRIENSMRKLHDFGPAVYEQKTSLSNLDAFIQNFNTTELSLIEEEYHRQKARLLSKKSILKALNTLKRRALYNVQSAEVQRLALGLRTMNSYQLSVILSFLEPHHTARVCKYWAEIHSWDQKQRTAPFLDYKEEESITSNAGLHQEVDPVNIDDELNNIIGHYVDNEINSSKLLASSHTSTDKTCGTTRGAYVGSLHSATSRARSPSQAHTHTPRTSALMQLIKVICMFTEQTMPTHSQAHTSSRATHSSLRPFLSGRLHTSTSTQPLPLSWSTAPVMGSELGGAVIAINSMSAGGSVVHILCSAGSLERTPHTVSGLAATTRYVCGCTQFAVEQYIQTRRLCGPAWQKHLRQSSSLAAFPWRGIVVNNGESVPPSCAPVDVLSAAAASAAGRGRVKKRVAFCFAGHGTPWQERAQQLWHSSSRFREVLVEGCTGLPIDVTELFSMPTLSWIQLQLPDFGITLVQIGLTVLLQEVGICPDVLVGQGVGEIACSFADGCTSIAESIRIAYFRSQLGQSLELGGGLMLEAELDLKSGVEFIKEFPNTVIACHNSPTKVTFSGTEEEIKHIEDALLVIGVSTRLLSTGGVPYHSRLHSRNAAAIKTLMKEATLDIPLKLRSNRWISTSCTKCIMAIPHRCCYPCLDYEVHNICNIVDFASALPELSSDMFVFEIGSSVLVELFQETAASGGGGGGGVVYQSVDGSGDSALALADQLWLHGTPLTFARKPCLTPIRDRLAINWEQDMQVPRIITNQAGANTQDSAVLKSQSQASDGHSPPPSSLKVTPPRASRVKVRARATATARPRTELHGVIVPSSHSFSGGLHDTTSQPQQLEPLIQKPTRNSSSNSNSKTTHASQTAPPLRGYAVHLPVPGDLSSLQWRENNSEPNCEIKFCGINPIDSKVLSVKDDDEDEDEDEEGGAEELETGCHFGCEFSGVREDGVAVMGLLRTGCLASHINTTRANSTTSTSTNQTSECCPSPCLLWPLPAYLSLEAAATLPRDYCTAYDALVGKAHLQPGQLVLIQDICSGVGQAAFQICRYRHCPVWALGHFSSADKRQWVHDNIGVELDCLFDSPSDPLLREAIYKHSHGAGVDIVLHATARKVEPGEMEILKQFGQFCVVEESSGKEETFSASSLQLAVKKHISVHFINVLAMLDTPLLCEQLQRRVQDGLLNGEVVPKPFKVYTEVETALISAQDNECSGVKTLVQLGDTTRLFASDGNNAGKKEKAIRVLKTSGTHVIIGECNKNTLKLASFLLQKGASKIFFMFEDNFDTDMSFPDWRMSGVRCDLSLAGSTAEMLHTVGADLVGLWHMDPFLCAEGKDKTEEEKDKEKEGEWLQKLKHVDQGTRSLPSLELFVVWCGGSGFSWAPVAVCQERKDLAVPLPAVAVQVKLPVAAAGSVHMGAAGEEVALLLEHVGEISCCDNTLVLIS